MSSLFGDETDEEEQVEAITPTGELDNFVLGSTGDSGKGKERMYYFDATFGCSSGSPAVVS